MSKRIYYGWWIVAIVFMISAYGSGVISFSFTAFFEPIINEFGWSYARVSIAASIRGMEFALLAPLVGIIFDLLGPRKLIFTGTMITGLGLFILSRINSLAAFYGAFIVIASGSSTFMGVVPMTIANRWFDRNASIATGIIICGIAAGGLLVPPVTMIIDNFHWRTALVILGLATWICVAPLSLMVRDSPERYGGLPEKEKKEKRLQSGQSQVKYLETEETGVFHILRTRFFWHLAVGLLCHVMSLHSVVTHVMPYLSSIGIRRTMSSFVTSAIPILSIPGRIGFGWLGDRFNKKRVMASGIALTGISMIMFAGIDILGAWILVPFLILFGIGYGGPIPIIASLIRENFGIAGLGANIGFNQGFAMIGSVTGQILAGWIFDTYGTYKWTWLAYGVIAILGSISVLTVPVYGRDQGKN